MSLHIIHSDDTTLALASELTDADAPELARALEGLTGAGGVPTVDLSAISHISGACIGALVTAWVDLVARDRWFDLRAPDAVWERLGAAGVARVFFHRPGAPTGTEAPQPVTARRDGVLAAETPAGGPTDPRSDESVNAEMDRYLERIAELEGELVDARERENALTSERNDLAVEMRGRLDELERLRAEVDTARAEAERARGTADELAGARERIAELERTALTLESRERSVAAELADARASLSGLQEAAARDRQAPKRKATPAKKRSVKKSPSAKKGASKRTAAKKPRAPGKSSKVGKPAARKAGAATRGASKKKAVRGAGKSSRKVKPKAARRSGRARGASRGA